MQQVRPEETVLDLHGLDFGENDVFIVSLETPPKLVLAWRALRALRACAARRAQRRGGHLGVLRACAPLSIHVRPGAGEADEAQGPTTHITTRVRACGRTCVKAPRLATSLASLVLVRLA